ATVRPRTVSEAREGEAGDGDDTATAPARRTDESVAVPCRYTPVTLPARPRTGDRIAGDRIACSGYDDPCRSVRGCRPHGADGVPGGGVRSGARAGGRGRPPPRGARPAPRGRRR